MSQSLHPVPRLKVKRHYPQSPPRDAHALAAQVAPPVHDPERLPLSGHYRLICTIIATAWVLDSTDLGRLARVLGSVKTEIRLSAAQAGALGPTSLTAMFPGAGLSGLLADRFGPAGLDGRRRGMSRQAGRVSPHVGGLDPSLTRPCAKSRWRRRLGAAWRAFNDSP